MESDGGGFSFKSGFLVGGKVVQRLENEGLAIKLSIILQHYYKEEAYSKD